MKARFLLPVVILALVLTALLSVNQQAQAVRLAAVPAFTVQTVKSGSGVGDWSVLQLSNNFPNIVYFDTNQKTLFFVRYSGATWSTPLEVDAAQRGHILPASDMVIQSNGQPAVVYATDTNRLFYATLSCSATTCTSTPQQVTVTPALTAPAQNPVLALDNSGNPHILARYNAKLAYFTRSSGNWSLTDLGYSVDAAEKGAPISMARTSTGDLKAVYYGGDFHLYFIERTGGTWQSPVDLTANATDFPSLGHNGNGVSITVDHGDNAQVAAAMTISSKQWLYLFVNVDCTGTNCRTFNFFESLNNLVSTMEISGVQVRVDSLNFPRISYYINDGSGTAGLKFIYWDGTAYQSLMVDPRAEVGRRSSLAITDSDAAYISYYGGSTVGGLLLATEGQPLPVFDNFLYLPVIMR